MNDIAKLIHARDYLQRVYKRACEFQDQVSKACHWHREAVVRSLEPRLIIVGFIEALHYGKWQGTVGAVSDAVVSLHAVFDDNAMDVNLSGDAAIEERLSPGRDACRSLSDIAARTMLELDRNREPAGTSSFWNSTHSSIESACRILDVAIRSIENLPDVKERLLGRIRDKAKKRNDSGSVTPQPSIPPLILGGPSDTPMVFGNRKPRLTKARYNVVQALLAAGDAGLNKDELVIKSGHTDARQVLQRLIDSDHDWAQVLSMAEATGGRYYARTR